LGGTLGSPRGCGFDHKGRREQTEKWLVAPGGDDLNTKLNFYNVRDVGKLRYKKSVGGGIKGKVGFRYAIKAI